LDPLVELQIGQVFFSSSTPIKSMINGSRTFHLKKNIAFIWLSAQLGTIVESLDPDQVDRVTDPLAGIPAESGSEPGIQ